jgi:hypothetical protein
LQQWVEWAGVRPAAQFGGEGWSVIGETVTVFCCSGVGVTGRGEQYLFDQGIIQNKPFGGGSVRPALLGGGGG